MNYHRILVYGTLRKDCYNRKAHIPNAISLGTTKLSGFQMYRKIQNRRIADNFPFVVKTGFKSHKIKVEMLLLTSKELRKIMKLENQYLVIPVQIEGYKEPFLMWVQDDEYLKSLPEGWAVRILSDWIPYAKKENIL